MKKYLILILFTQIALAESKQITVTGSCHRMITPDRGAITVTADVLDPDLKTASEKATAAYEAVKNDIKRLKLEALELQTVEYSLVEDKEYEKNKMVSKGFRARMGLRVTTSDIQKLGEVIAAASREGIKDVGSLSTFLSDEKQREEQILCLQDAALNAKEKASRLAVSLGAKMGQVISISEPEAVIRSPGPIRPMGQMMALRAETATVPTVEAGQQDISVTIQTTFQLE